MKYAKDKPYSNVFNGTVHMEWKHSREQQEMKTLIDKCSYVVHTCKTIDQLVAASKYLQLAYKTVSKFDNYWALTDILDLMKFTRIKLQTLINKQ